MTISKHKLAYLGKMNKKITHDLLNVKIVRGNLLEQYSEGSGILLQCKRL
jgi:hypothetical protein